jgi:hypothetical protein
MVTSGIANVHLKAGPLDLGIPACCGNAFDIGCTEKLAALQHV